MPFQSPSETLNADIVAIIIVRVIYIPVIIINIVVSPTTLYHHSIALIAFNQPQSVSHRLGSLFIGSRALTRYHWQYGMYENQWLKPTQQQFTGETALCQTTV